MSNKIKPPDVKALGFGASQKLYYNGKALSPEEEKRLAESYDEQTAALTEFVLPRLAPNLARIQSDFKLWDVRIREAVITALSPTGLKVMITGQTYDGKKWIHLSTSRPDRIPNYADLTKVKDMFLGEEAKAIFILPPKSEHINNHPFCLHLWQCVDGDGLPDFRLRIGEDFGI